MDFELRVPARDDGPGFFLPVMTGFGTPEPTEADLEDEYVIWEPERSLGIVEDGTWVAVTGAFSFELTVPGGALVPAAGVTMVGVLTTHRRRGMLRALMVRQLDDIAEAGEPLAVLTASESSIYRRFGFGLAASSCRLDLESARTQLVQPSRAGGRCRLVRTADMVEPLTAAYEACRRVRAGAVTRSPGYWERLQRDRSSWRGGASAMHWLVHEDDTGRPDGFCTYRVKEAWPDRVSDGTVFVHDLCGADPDVEAALWEHVLSVDLTNWVKALNRPVDDPIRWRVADPRQVRTREVTDWLWARALDVPAALSARTWGSDGTLVLEVVDQFRPQSGGRFRIEADADGTGTCTATSDGPDLTLDQGDLGALYLGGVAPSTLAAAGRMQQDTDGALARADRLFATHPTPFCMTMF